MKAGMIRQQKHLYTFGPFTLDEAERVLMCADEPVALTPKALETLLVLVKTPGQVHEKEDLLSRIWPDTFVEEANLAVNISTLRKVLGETPEGSQYIETVPRRGYRFAAEVKKSSVESNASPAQAEKPVGQIEADTVPDSLAPAFVKERIDSGGEGFSARGGNRKRVAAAILAALLLTAAFVAYLSSSKTKVRDPSQPRRLAVLPFQNQRPDADTDFLGLALADTIITKLGYVGSLVVRPSSYVQKYANKDVDPVETAKELDVDTLLMGTYFKDGPDLRITPQLIDVTTGDQLWGDTIDVKYENLLSLQDIVARQVIKGLDLKLTPDEDEQLALDHPQNPQAYESYLMGRYLLSTQKHKTAIEMLQKSVELDPGYYLAWAYLGRAYSISALQYFGGREDYLKAQADYEQSLDINPGQIETRVFMAILYTETGHVEEAVAMLREVVKKNPNIAAVHWQLSYAYRYSGMLKESIEEGRLARSLDPGLTSHQFNSYFYAGDYDGFLNSLPTREDDYVLFYRGLGYYYKRDKIHAAAAFDRAYELNRSTVITRIGRAFSLSIAGDNRKGSELLKATEAELERGGVADGEITYKVAQGYAALGDNASAVRALRRSVEEGFFCYPYLVSDPLTENLRGLPEYAATIEIARARHEKFKRRFF